MLTQDQIEEWNKSEEYFNSEEDAFAFKTKKEAEEFIKQHKGGCGEGYTRWDETLGKEVPCNEDHEDAEYNYGWAYSNYISTVKLV